jgi:hypothetical protein
MLAAPDVCMRVSHSGEREVQAARVMRKWRVTSGEQVLCLVGIPPPLVFSRKSSKLLENKGVEICGDAKEFGRI